MSPESRPILFKEEERKMDENHIDELNQSSMNIILNAGNARDFYNEALDHAETGETERCEELLKMAEKEIIKAHRIQTRIIQEAVEQEHPDMTVLFIHAQDTLMTVDSEFRMVNRMVNLYKKLNEVKR